MGFSEPPAAVVVNPDGIPGVVMLPSAPKQPPTRNPRDPNFTFLPSPVVEQDRTAQSELNKMKQEDATSFAQHAHAAPEFYKMFKQDAEDIAQYETFPSYTTACAHPTDHAVTAHIERYDAAMQRAVAEHAAGPDPIVPDPNATPTPGMDWLARMKAEDERLQKSVAAANAALNNAYMNTSTTTSVGEVN